MTLLCSGIYLFVHMPENPQNPADEKTTPPPIAIAQEPRPIGICLSTPWISTANVFTSASWMPWHIRESRKLQALFLAERSRVHEVYIREEHKTKRLSMIIAATLTMVSVVIMVFAPAGRETLSYWLGAAILVIAAGSMGYKRIRGKTPGFSLRADDASGDDENSK